MTSKQLDPSSGHNAVSSKMQSNQDHNDKHVSTFHFTQLQAEEGLHFPIQSRPISEKHIPIFPFHPTPSRRWAAFSNPIKAGQWQARLNISVQPNSKQKKGYIFQSNKDQSTTSATQYFHFIQLQTEKGLHFPIQSRPMNDKRISILPFHPTPSRRRATFSKQESPKQLVHHEDWTEARKRNDSQTPFLLTKLGTHSDSKFQNIQAPARTVRNQGTHPPPLQWPWETRVPPPHPNHPETKSTHNNSANIGIVYLLIHVESVRGLIKERHIVLEVSDVDCDCGHSSPGGASCSSISGQDRESVGRPHFIVERSTTGDLTGLRIDLEAGRQTRNDNILLMCTMIKAKQTSKQKNVQHYIYLNMSVYVGGGVGEGGGGCAYLCMFVCAWACVCA